MNRETYGIVINSTSAVADSIQEISPESNASLTIVEVIRLLSASSVFTFTINSKTINLNAFNFSSVISDESSAILYFVASVGKLLNATFEMNPQNHISKFTLAQPYFIPLL